MSCVSRVTGGGLAVLGSSDLPLQDFLGGRQGAAGWLDKEKWERSGKRMFWRDVGFQHILLTFDRNHTIEV